MAGDAVIGALRIVLGMDTAAFEDGAKKAASGVQSFGKQVATIAAGIGLEKIVEAGTKAFINFTKEALNTADALYKMSQRTGVPVELLSGLKHAAELSDVSIEGLARSFKVLQIEINKASVNAITPAAAAFQRLGINIKDLSKQSPEEQFLRIVDALSKVEDHTLKVSLAAAIFGKKFGPDMIPFLDQGRKGIEETIERARQLGLVISTETAKNAEEFNDRMKDLGSTFKGIALTTFAPFSAAMAESAKKMVDWVIKVDLVKKSAEVLVRTITFLSDNIRILGYVLAALLARMAVGALIAFGSAMATLAVSVTKAAAAFLLLNSRMLITATGIGIVLTAVLLFTNQLDPFLKSIEDIGTKLKLDSVISVFIQGMQKAGIETSALTKTLADLGFISEKTRVQLSKPTPPPFDDNALKKAQEFAQGLSKITLESRELSGEFAGRLAPGFIAAAQSMKIINEDGSNLEKVLTLSDEKARLLNEALLILQNNKLSQEFLTPWQEFERQMERINLQLEKGKLNSEIFAQASIKAATDMNVKYGQAAATIAGGFADAFKVVAEQNKRWAGVAKAAAIATALANTFVAANKAMAETPGGLPFQLAAAAAVTAAGLANVYKISQTEFAQGGSFKVGGSGGIDSQLISFAATPGEMVDVRKPGATGPSSEITVRGINSREFFTGDMLRSMVEGLNAAHSDGYKLKFAE